MRCCVDPETEEKVAVKVYTPQALASGALEWERHVILELDHPNLMPLYDEQPHEAGLVFPYMSCDLYDALITTQFA